MSTDSSAHHGDDLQILQVSPLCCQNLFSNEIGFVGGISLEIKAYLKPLLDKLY